MFADNSIQDVSCIYLFIYLFIESVRGTEKGKKYIFLLMFLKEQEKMKCQIYDILT